MGTSTASERFLKGAKWLENELKHDEEKLKDELRKAEEQRKRLSEELAKLGESAEEQIRKQKIWDQDFSLKYQIENLKKELKLRYRFYETDSIYVLKKIESNLVDDFCDAAIKAPFWKDAYVYLFENPHLLWYFREIGFEGNRYFLDEVNDLVKRQSVEGYVQSNEFNHSGPLRVLVATRPESETLLKVINYWIENWKDLSYDHRTVAVGILALAERDHELYSDVIREEIDYLKNQQKKDGSWSRRGSSGVGDIEDTSYVISAIARVDGIKDLWAQKGFRWLIRRQQKDGSWANNCSDTTDALLALLAMGEGPRIPLELVNQQFAYLKQSLGKGKPVFIHTSPLYKDSLHIREINDRISNMLHRAKKEIRITSPFIDMFYEEIINLRQNNLNLIVKVITRPKGEAEGLREKIAKNVTDLLNIATKGNVIQSSIVHSRMVIIDDTEVVISSADLTRDQLFDEFNAGIWTSDKETVAKAVEFFENLFQLEKARQQPQR